MKISVPIIFLASLGLIDTIYISLSKYQCEACNSIHNTVWGQPLGFPIAWMGVFMYAFILTAVLSRRPRIALLASILGISGTVVLVLAQLLILKQYCIFCLLSAVVLTCLWAALWMEEKEWHAVRHSWLMPLVVAGIFVVLVQAVQPTNPLDVKESVPLTTNLPEAQQHAAENVNPDPTLSVSGPGVSFAQPATDSDGANGTPAPQKSPSPESAAVSKPIEKQGLRFFDQEGGPVIIDVSKEPILFIASRCDTCTLALSLLTKVPTEKRPVIIVTWIPENSDLATEKQNVQKKLQICQLDSAQVLYDLDRLNPAPTVPRFENFSAK